MIELKYHAPAPKGSEVNVELHGTFSCNSEKVSVKGFYAGNETYIVRFLPVRSGTYNYKISGIVMDEGVVHVTEEQCSATMVHVEDTHFVYNNGDTYFPFGTTVYAMTHQTDSLVGQTLDSLQRSPFNKVRFCVFPKHYVFNENEPACFPFCRDENGRFRTDRPDYFYWNRLEDTIKKLNEMKIQADLILFHPYDCWGFSSMPMEENFIYLDYALRRLSAFPNIWWSLANEYDLLFERKEEDWYEIEQFIAEHDPYHHLLSNHNFIKLYDFSRKNVTHCCIQSNDVFRTAALLKKYHKPVIFDEMRYEGNISEPWGNLSAVELVNRFWKVCSVGGYATHGETFFSEENVLWWSKGGTLKGLSTARIGFLREIMEDIGKPLEPWEETSLQDFINPEEKDSDGVHPMIKLIDSVDAETKYLFEMNNVAFTGRYDKDVFVKYYGNQCPVKSTIFLPKEGTYRLLVVDTWAMETKVVSENASGATCLDLPGKEGIALIAKKIK